MKIIIIEDAPNIRNNLRKIISEIEGFDIRGEAEDTPTAVKLINETKPDIIILDADLKNSSGFDVLKYIKGSKYPENPVVIMFSNQINLYRENALTHKADYFFDKTNEIDALINILSSVNK